MCDPPTSSGYLSVIRGVLPVKKKKKNRCNTDKYFVLLVQYSYGTVFIVPKSGLQFIESINDYSRFCNIQSFLASLLALNTLHFNYFVYLFLLHRFAAHLCAEIF